MSKIKKKIFIPSSQLKCIKMLLNCYILAIENVIPRNFMLAFLRKVRGWNTQ